MPTRYLKYPSKNANGFNSQGFSLIEIMISISIIGILVGAVSYWVVNNTSLMQRLGRGESCQTRAQGVLSQFKNVDNHSVQSVAWGLNRTTLPTNLLCQGTQCSNLSAAQLYPFPILTDNGNTPFAGASSATQIQNAAKQSNSWQFLNSAGVVSAALYNESGYCDATDAGKGQQLTSGTTCTAFGCPTASTVLNGEKIYLKITRVGSAGACDNQGSYKLLPIPNSASSNNRDSASGDSSIIDSLKATVTVEYTETVNGASVVKSCRATREFTNGQDIQVPVVSVNPVTQNVTSGQVPAAIDANALDESPVTFICKLSLGGTTTGWINCMKVNNAIKISGEGATVTYADNRRVNLNWTVLNTAGNFQLSVIAIDAARNISNEMIASVLVTTPTPTPTATPTATPAGTPTATPTPTPGPTPITSCTNYVNSCGGCFVAIPNSCDASGCVQNQMCAYVASGTRAPTASELSANLCDPKPADLGQVVGSCSPSPSCDNWVTGPWGACDIPSNTQTRSVTNAGYYPSPGSCPPAPPNTQACPPPGTCPDYTAPASCAAVCNVSSCNATNCSGTQDCMEVPTGGSHVMTPAEISSGCTPAQLVAVSCTQASCANYGSSTTWSGSCTGSLEFGTNPLTDYALAGTCTGVDTTSRACQTCYHYNNATAADCASQGITTCNVTNPSCTSSACPGNMTCNKVQGLNYYLPISVTCPDETGTSLVACTKNQSVPPNCACYFAASASPDYCPCVGQVYKDPSVPCGGIECGDGVSCTSVTAIKASLQATCGAPPPPTCGSGTTWVAAASACLANTVVPTVVTTGSYVSFIVESPDGVDCSSTCGGDTPLCCPASYPYHYNLTYQVGNSSLDPTCAGKGYTFCCVGSAICAKYTCPTYYALDAVAFTCNVVP